jgi:alpha-galactosidase
MPKIGCSLQDKQICLNGRFYDHGIGTHADSELVIKSSVPLKGFRALAGVDDHSYTRKHSHRVVFSVEVSGREVWQSRPLGVKDDPGIVEVALGGAKEFVLKAREMDGKIDWAHLAWAEAVVTTEVGLDLVIGSKEDHGFLPDGPPISFKYDGQESAKLLSSWRRTYEKKKINNDITLHLLTYVDPKTGLECRFEMKEFHDFPAVDWVVKFKNGGTEDTPILEDIRSLDFSWLGMKKATLYYSKGSDAKIDDFLYQSRDIPVNVPVTLGSVDGRSSGCGTLPFFNVVTPAGGVVVAVGWTGQWAGEVGFDGYIARVWAGMEKTHLKLHPGEEIRTPSSVLLFWNGKETIRGNNLLRRLISKHYTYRPDGKTIPAPITVEHWGGMKTESHLKRLELYEKFKFDYDYYWIDAGWYGPKEDYCPDVFTGGWAMYVGYWDHNPTPHPNGLRPIADVIHAKGKKFLLWFEPERALAGTPWIREHPEWFLNSKTVNSDFPIRLFNLGIPEALRWITDEISKRITAWGIDCYRQDFNMAPLPFWREADAPDRQGMAEIRHIEGLYTFWDELLRRHPGLIIDNCSSGGRRIDIETIRRSIPLWRSDYQCFDSSPTGTQSQFLGLSYWIPYHTVGTMKRPGDTYNFRSAMGTGVVFQLYECEYEVPDPNNPHDWHRKMMKDQRRAIPAYLGDYYPLKEGTLSSADWLAYQMHRDDLGEGVVMAFRREDSPFISGVFNLKEVDEEGMYEIEDADTGKVETHSGKSLKSGLTITIETKRTARLLFYRKKSSNNLL